MNANIIKLVKSQSEKWCVAEAEDTGRLFCNGHIIIPTPEGMGVGGECNSIERMSIGTLKLWRELQPCGAPVSRGRLVGESLREICRRFHMHDAKFAHFDERYVRCFDVTAEFHGERADTSFVVTEGGIKVGIIMPMRHQDDLKPWTEIPDGVLFHECSDDV